MSTHRFEDDPAPQQAIVAASKDDLDRHGHCYLGVGSTKSQEEADTSDRVMLDVIRAGRGDAGLAAELRLWASRISTSTSWGRADVISTTRGRTCLSASCWQRQPNSPRSTTTGSTDSVTERQNSLRFDYVVVNRLPILKLSASSDRMLARWNALHPKARIRLAFNVMSKHVEWERDFLCRLSFGMLGDFLTREVSRPFSIRHDYGLYEYTAHVYREA